MNVDIFDPGQVFSQNVADATSRLFGQKPLARQVLHACNQYDQQRQDILHGRGIAELTIAIVGAKGQGKTWIARQLLTEPRLREQLPSGDLAREATTRLFWIGPASPDKLNNQEETYLFCPQSAMVDLGRPFVLLDTPGVTDANRPAADRAKQALSLSPIKLLVLARDQIRSAVQSDVARLADGSICIPVITMVEPKEIDSNGAATDLSHDVRQLTDHLRQIAPKLQILQPIFVLDFDIAGPEEKVSQQFVDQLRSRLSDQPLDQLALSSTRENQLDALDRRFRKRVNQLFETELPQLSGAVRRLHDEAERLPEQVVQSMLGSELILQTGVRSRLRAQMINDTSQIFFPYRSLMSLLHLTQGAWDRVLLALTGSLPSLFGTLTAWAKNFQQSRQVSWEIQEGVRQRMQRQVEDRLQPLCEQFHRAVLRMQNRDSSPSADIPVSSMRMTGIEELQTQSREIFETSMAQNRIGGFGIQIYGLIGTIGFWTILVGPIVNVYRQYFNASWYAISDASAKIENFPHPPASLFFTSLLLALLPLLIYCMFVLTISLRKRRVQRVSEQIQHEHQRLIQKLKDSGVLRLHFEDRLLDDAQFLLNLRQKS